MSTFWQYVIYSLQCGKQSNLSDFTEETPDDPSNTIFLRSPVLPALSSASSSSLKLSGKRKRTDDIWSALEESKENREKINKMIKKSLSSEWKWTKWRPWHVILQKSCTIITKNDLEHRENSCSIINYYLYSMAC